MVTAAEADAAQFYQFNDLEAGARLHEKMQNIKVLAQAIRSEVLTQRRIKEEIWYEGSFSKRALLVFGRAPSIILEIAFTIFV